MKEKPTNNVAMDDVIEERLRVILKEGAETPMSFEWAKPELPPFYDEKKFRLGQRAFYNNIFSMMIAKLCGLVSLLSIRTILDVIMFTKKSGTPCLAYRRYASTILHTLVWLSNEPETSKKFLESLKIVRRMHCVAFKRSTEAGVHEPTQLDMALAQFGFVGYIMVSGEQLGIKTTHEELEGVAHFWRVIGSMLGMEDRFNLCTWTLEETSALCQRILEEVFLPSLVNKNEHFDGMARVLLEGLWYVDISIDPQAFTAFTYHLASSSATNNNNVIELDTSSMPFYSWWQFSLQCFVLKYLLRPSAWWSPLFRAYFNGMMRLSLFLVEKYPYIASRTFGKRYAKINIFRSQVD